MTTHPPAVATAPLPIPEPIILVSAGVDVQARYLACLTVGWGLDGQAWALSWDVVDGDPRDRATLDALLQELAGAQFAHPAYGALPVAVVGIDSGFASDHVYRAVRAAPRPRWAYATKGELGRLGDPVILPMLDQRDYQGRRGARPIRLNTDALKQELMATLHLAPPARGAWHFSKSLDAEFFAQLASEELKPKFNDAGVQVGHAWVKMRERNEALDAACINVALWHFIRDKHLLLHLEGLVGPEEARRRWLDVYPSGRRF